MQDHIDDYIEDAEDIYRLVVHPMILKSKAFDPRNMFHLGFVQTSMTVETSLLCQKFLGPGDTLHAYGCRNASKANVRFRAARSKIKPADRRVYCGAYQLVANDIRDIQRAGNIPDIDSADVVHEPEDGENAHVSLRIKINDDPDYDIFGTLTEITNLLWNRCHGPLLHVCECDTDMSPHPSGAIPDAPRGRCCGDIEANLSDNV
jgi:hypothetical protein